MRFFNVLFLVIISQLTYAQCNDSLIYTESEKESFVRAYLHVKNNKPDSPDKSLYEMADKYDIHAKQFGELLKTSKTKKPFSVEEKSFIAEIQAVKKAYAEELKSVEKRTCESFNLHFEGYMNMQKQYRSCMRFQRSLSEYFEKWK